MDGRWEGVREWGGREGEREGEKEEDGREGEKEGGRIEEGTVKGRHGNVKQLPPTLTAAGSCPAEEAEVAPAKHQPSMEEEVGQCWHCHKATHTSTHTSSNRYISSLGYIDDCEKEKGQVTAQFNFTTLQ